MFKPTRSGAGFLTRDQTAKLYKIPYDAETVIGRDSDQSSIVVNDPFASRRHVKLYTVDFDETVQRLQPALYAQNISSRSDQCFWSPRQLTRPTEDAWQRIVQQQHVLLHSGDRLKVADASFTFTSTNLLSEQLPANWDPVQAIEHEVCLCLPPWLAC